MGRRQYVPLRRCDDIPIRRREHVPLRRLGDVPLIRRRVLHLRRTCDVAGTYREMSLRRRHNIVLPGGFLACFTYLTFSSQNFLTLSSKTGKVVKKS